MRAILIEDEMAAAEHLKQMLNAIEPEMDVITRLDSVEQAVKWFETNEHPDIVFSDIRLADGLCFDLFKQINIEAPLIFTTAYDQYLVKAFDYYSVDYLLKPIQEDKLRNALEKSKKFFLKKEGNSSDVLSQVQKLAATLNPEKKYCRKFLVKFRDELIPVGIEDIAFYFVQDRNVFMQCFDNRQYLMTQTLSELEEMVDPQRFYRANRKFIVSMSSIEKIKPTLAQKIVLELKPNSPEKVVVSRSKVKEFTTWLSS